MDFFLPTDYSTLKPHLEREEDAGCWKRESLENRVPRLRELREMTFSKGMGKLFSYYRLLRLEYGRDSGKAS